MLRRAPGLTLTIGRRQALVDRGNPIGPLDGYRGRYVFHRHNLEHEDVQMMGNFQVT